mmetsp:Transcript_68516/g.198796  ORF Transcript_68516/g.198796 Transcript_68516/m.198796 type:complete len:238 (+) Transcript_68516:935-1648(+)
MQRMYGNGMGKSFASHCPEMVPLGKNSNTTSTARPSSSNSILTSITSRFAGGFGKASASFGVNGRGGTETPNKGCDKQPASAAGSSAFRACIPGWCDNFSNAQWSCSRWNWSSLLSALPSHESSASPSRSRASAASQTRSCVNRSRARRTTGSLDGEASSESSTAGSSSPARPKSVMLDSAPGVLKFQFDIAWPLPSPVEGVSPPWSSPSPRRDHFAEPSLSRRRPGAASLFRTSRG